MISCPSSRSTGATTHKMFKRMELWMVVLKLLKKTKQWNCSAWDPQFLFSEKITRKSKSLRIILPSSYGNFLPKSSLGCLLQLELLTFYFHQNGVPRTTPEFAFLGDVPSKLLWSKIVPWWGPQFWKKVGMTWDWKETSQPPSNSPHYTSSAPGYSSVHLDVWGTRPSTLGSHWEWPQAVWGFMLTHVGYTVQHHLGCIKPPQDGWTIKNESSVLRQDNSGFFSVRCWCTKLRSLYDSIWSAKKKEKPASPYQVVRQISELLKGLWLPIRAKHSEGSQSDVSTHLCWMVNML